MDDRVERLQRLIEAHAPELRRHAHGRTTPEDADDAIAAAFHSALYLMDHVPADPLPWLIRMTDGAIDRKRPPS